MKYIFSFLFFFSAMIASHAQTVQLLTSGTKTSLRGLSVVSDSVLWLSGSSGKVARSTDGGNSFTWMTVKGFEKTDFRDIEGFDKNTAVIMGVDSPAYILKTIDAGASWKTVYRNDTHGIFLDAMDFDEEGNGVAIGDPLPDRLNINRFFMIVCFKNNESWSDMFSAAAPLADKGEACFASSGTNIINRKKLPLLFVSGGITSHIYIDGKKEDIPLLQSKESTGANSVAAKNKKLFIVVGGDFSLKDSVKGNCAVTKNGGRTWFVPTAPPSGYRSCIEYLYKKTWITCGLNGVDITYNDGSNFTQISRESFHVCRKAKRGNTVFFAGNNGKIGKLQLN